MKAVADMLDDPTLQAKGDATEMAGVFRVAWELRERPGAVADLFARPALRRGPGSGQPGWQPGRPGGGGARRAGPKAVLPLAKKFWNG